MDEGTLRGHAERHVETLMKGDLAAAFSDLTAQAQTQLEPYVLNFPSPVEHAEMISLEPGSNGYVVTLEISGGGRELKIETIWQDVAGRPMIIAVKGPAAP